MRKLITLILCLAALRLRSFARNTSYDNKRTRNGQETDNTTTNNKPTTNEQQPPTNNCHRVLECLLDGEKPMVSLMEVCGYKDKRSFRKSVLNEMLDSGLVAMTHPKKYGFRRH